MHLQHRPEHGITKRSYIEAVLAGLEAFSTASCARTRPASPPATAAAERPAGAAARPLAPPARLEVRLLLSIDRREGAAAAAETVRVRVAAAAAPTRTTRQHLP